jgi:hypothetical protein
MMMRKVTVEHRYAPLPPESLRSPKLTNAKVESEGHCRMCLRPASVRRLTRHHLVPARWWIRQPLPLRSYRNAHAGVIPLCSPCHQLVDAKDHDERMGARRMLRRSLTQQEVAFAIFLRGKPWLDRQYPTT